jgi:hypothetical protein
MTKCPKGESGDSDSILLPKIGTIVSTCSLSFVILSAPSISKSRERTRYIGPSSSQATRHVLFPFCEDFGEIHWYMHHLTLALKEYAYHRGWSFHGWEMRIQYQPHIRTSRLLYSRTRHKAVGSLRCRQILVESDARETNKHIWVLDLWKIQSTKLFSEGFRKDEGPRGPWKIDFRPAGILRDSFQLRSKI